MSTAVFQESTEMAEPTSSGAAGFAAYKLALAYGVPAGLAGVLVMLLTHPKTRREWVASLLSTISASIYGGAVAIQYFGLQAWLDNERGALLVGGIYLLCGLPAWVVVRAFYAWTEKRRNKDLQELARDVAAAIKEAKDVANG